MGPASHSQQPATMDIFEIAERKLVPGFGPFAMGLIDPKIPFAIFSESVHANEFVLRLRHRMMIAPRIFLINDRTPLSDQFLFKSERVLVLFYRPALNKQKSGTRDENAARHKRSGDKSTEHRLESLGDSPGFYPRLVSSRRTAIRLGH